MWDKAKHENICEVHRHLIGRAVQGVVWNSIEKSLQRSYKMTPNPNDQKLTCDVCHQSFNSERELQEHKQNAHSQRKQNETQPGSERNSKDSGKEFPGQDEPKREKIA
jgi:adenosine deaminase